MICAGVSAALAAGLGVSCGSQRPAVLKTEAPPSNPSPGGRVLDRIARADSESALKTGQGVMVPQVPLLDGGRFDQQEVLRSAKAAVFVMTSVGCPVSIMYAPRIAALEREYSARGVRFVFVNPVGAESLAEMQVQAREQGFKGRYIPDADGLASEALGARTTTEAFVLDAGGVLRYRGAVDDQYGVGAAKDAARTQFLRDAIEAVLSGKTPSIAVTNAPGCLIDPRSQHAFGADVAGAPTYHGEVSRILETSCVACHHTGGPAPFSLASPNALLGRTRMIEAVLRDGLMPPSHGLSGTMIEAGMFTAPIQITAKDKETVLDWLRANRPLGDEANAIQHQHRTLGWSFGMPDTLMVTPSVRVGAEGPLVYGRVTLVSKVQTDQVLAQIEFKPVKQGSIHHALVWLVPPGVSIPESGDIPRGGGQIQLLGAFSPGQGLVRYPEGLSCRIPVGSVLLADIYARPMGKPMMVSLRIAGKFVASPSAVPNPATEVRSLLLRAPVLDIPPEKAACRHVVEHVLESNVRLISVTPYMRSRGRAVSVEARLPDGRVRLLLDAKDYDFRWVLRHVFAEPVDLPAGTRLTLTGVHDNTAGNHANPDPGAYVRNGSTLQDEALAASIELLEVAGK